jgi:hypothetical protein
VGVWGSTALVWQRNRAGGSEIPQCVKHWLRRPMGQGLVCSACYSFSIWWRGEASPSHVFKVLMFQLSLMLYLNQASLQILIKVSGSWRSEGLWLCSGSHLGSLQEPSYGNSQDAPLLANGLRKYHIYTQYNFTQP